MPEALDQVRNQLNEYFNGLEKKQKTKLALSAILIILTLTGIILYFTRTTYVVLYNNLEPQHAGEVINALQSNNIKAKIGDTSGIVLVAKSDEKRAQIVIASEGLPTAKFSYDEVFSGNSFMMTSEERNKKLLVAQQNYLASTIEEITGVRRARVHLSVPENTGFMLSNRDEISKAAVYLDLDRNTSINAKSINGIATLVANAVQGLSVENVTIHGNDGRILNENKATSADDFGLTDQMNMQHSVKTELEKSITDFLSAVYGYGNVAVMANVKLDFDSEVTEIKEFSPSIDGETTGIVRSMQTLRQNVVTGGAGVIPGTDENVDDIPQFGEVEDEYSRYEEASDVINYEINELRRKIVRQQGQVQDITVAVFLNSKTLENGDLSEEERRELVNIISAAAGLDTRVVQVGVREFSAIDIWGDEPLAITDSRVPLWAWGIIAASVLGAIYFVIAARRKRKEEEEKDSEIEEIIETRVDEELDLELSGSQVKQQIEKLVNKNPEAIAQLLKNWLSED